jgi:hypothetical protein
MDLGFPANPHIPHPEPLVAQLRRLLLGAIPRENSMSDFVDEEHCTLCSRMWRSEREAFRANLYRLPRSMSLSAMLAR